MSGLSALKSKIRSLKDKIIIKPRLRSVITFSEFAKIERTGVIPSDVHKKGILLVPDPMTPEEWEELNDRLSSVYRVEEKLKDHVIVAPETPMPQYRVDDKLNIIIDSRIKTDLKMEQLLKELEEDERVFWKDSVAEKMEEELHSIEIKLQTLSEDMKIKHNILKMKIMNQNT